MTNANVFYNVTGRYMDGQKLIGYHLVGEDGSQSRESKERVIYLIGKGIITNMRLQNGPDNEVIIRGKGINLNNLPVYDIVKEKFRNDDVSQAAANSGVKSNENKVKNANNMGQFTILRRVMMKNKCLGYEVRDYSGKVTRKSRKDVIKLAVQRLISNASAQKVVRNDALVPEVILRGVGCELNKLPILIVTEDGKVIDPLADKTKTTIRAVIMKHAGLLKNNEKHKSKQFKSGDLIVCMPDGRIDVKDVDFVRNNYKRDFARDKALCDDYINGVEKYTIEIFGNQEVALKPEMVLSWNILAPKEV